VIGLRAAAAVIRRRWFGCALFLALAVALAFLTLPVVAILVEESPGALLDSLGDPGVTDALLLSLRTTLIAVAIIVLVGTPVAYVLATRRFRGREIVITLIELPLVMPPAVAGVALLAALGPGGLVGGAIKDADVSLVFETAGVVVALTFVAAPFFIRGAQVAFASVDRTWLEASRTLGAGEARTFLRIAVPAAAPGMLAGLALAWGRAVGEFGATLIFAGSFRGRTQTAPLAIYERLGTDFDAALALSAVLVVVSGTLLLSAKLLGGQGTEALRAAR
jgi:molybdate transport system permease protein